MARFVAAVIVGVAIVAATATVAVAAPDRTIAVIEVTGNHRTRTPTILTAAGVAVGTRVDDATAAVVRQRLLNTQLFSRVDVDVGATATGAGVTLAIHVDERWTLLPVPFGGASNGTWEAGVVVTEANLLGRRKTLVVGMSLSDRGVGGLVSYRDPAVAGTPWGFGLDVSYEDRTREELDGATVLDKFDERREFAALRVGYRFERRLVVGGGWFGFSTTPTAVDGFTAPTASGLVHGPFVEAEYEGRDARGVFRIGPFAQARVKLGLEALGATRAYRGAVARGGYTAAVGPGAVTIGGLYERSHGDALVDALNLGGRTGTRGFRSGGLWADAAGAVVLEGDVPVWRPCLGTLTGGAFVELGDAERLGTHTSYATVGVALDFFLAGIAAPGITLEIARSTGSDELVTALSIGSTF